MGYRHRHAFARKTQKSLFDAIVKGINSGCISLNKWNPLNWRSWDELQTIFQTWTHPKLIVICRISDSYLPCNSMHVIWMCMHAAPKSLVVQTSVNCIFCQLVHCPLLLLFFFLEFWLPFLFFEFLDTRFWFPPFFKFINEKFAPNRQCLLFFLVYKDIIFMSTIHVRQVLSYF